MMKVLILNGPNLNLLGWREPDIYGNTDFNSFYKTLKEEYKDKIDIRYFQSNHEGDIIDKLQQSLLDYDGVILNAGGFTHTSVAIRDAIASIHTPVIEVHISNINAREEFRHTSLIAPVCKGSIIGFGLNGYKLGIEYFLINENGTN